MSRNPRINRSRVCLPGCCRVPLRASERSARLLPVATHKRGQSAARRYAPVVIGRATRGPATADPVGVHVGGLALIRLLQFHTISFCGGLYPLPRRPTFRFRNVLHLVEARDRVAHMRGVLQRLFALLGKSELGCGYPVTNCLGELCHCFPSSGVSPCVRAAPVLVTTDYDGFLSSSSVVWLTSYSSRVDSAMRGSSISFLTRARSAWSDSCLGWFLCIVARCQESKGITGQLGTDLTTVELFFLPSSFDQFVPPCET